jgi:hypothetical protein
VDVVQACISGADQIFRPGDRLTVKTELPTRRLPTKACSLQFVLLLLPVTVLKLYYPPTLL